MKPEAVSHGQGAVSHEQTGPKTHNPKPTTNNTMRSIRVEKVTVNIGIGSPGERLEFAKELLQRLTGRTAIETKARRREPVFKLRPGLPIGVKVTLRGKTAMEFLDKALAARKRVLSSSSFDRQGNFAFGIAEYIDFPGAKYDPRIGMMGFDVCVTLQRPGRRVALRRVRSGTVGKGHSIPMEEAQHFAQEKLGAKLTTEGG